MVRAALAALSLALGLGLAAGAAHAREVPLLRARVTDEAGVLGARAAGIERTLADYERDTGHQFAVLVVRSLEGESLEGFSMRVAERWRLGDRRRDDGLLLLVAIDDRAARIEVGYGLEGAIPDVIAGRVMREHLTPRFAAGDYAGGIEAGLDALMRAARGESLGPAPRARRPTGAPQSLVFLLVGLSVLLRLPRVVRVPLGLVLGAAIGWVAFSSLPIAAGCALGLGLLALVLPTLRGRRFGVLWAGGSPTGRGSWGGSSRGGFSGGFSGGGGGFGGGGASGRW
ncbi:MAG: TPM domain-containing protein [Deltaproteobacteria bacterium]|nr:TPM domain-containing protein [Deltaproteobacteria bacterium]